MYQDIKTNKIKTGVIVAIFIIVITLIIYYICMAFDLGIMSIVIALAVSIISAWSSYFYSDKIILSLNGARPATPEEHKKLLNILDSLVVSAGLEHTPTLYVMEDAQPNAFVDAIVKAATDRLENEDAVDVADEDAGADETDGE